jgi:2-oxoglutarate-Fe(II)-dependent oxygenase superfamily protein
MDETTPAEGTEGVSVDFDELRLSCYGVGVRISDNTGGELCRRLRESLPPEFGDPDGTEAETVSYLVNADNAPGSLEPSGYRVTCGGGGGLAASTDEELLESLNEHIDNTIALCSRQKLFVHAGVVGWRGLAIVIPGSSLTGKSMLIAELVRRGAVYYSDKFAVLDDTGAVHPYRRALVLHGKERTEPNDLRLIREGASVEPLQIGLIVATPYRQGTAWRPSVLRGAPAVLSVLQATVRAREETARMLQVAARIAPNVVTVAGLRPEAAEVAPRILDAIDDALVSNALRAVTSRTTVTSRTNGDNTLARLGETAGSVASPALAADLAAVAERRLHSQEDQRAPFFRRLVAARYVRMQDFLSAEEHQRVLDFAFAGEDGFGDSGVVDQHGRDQKDYGFRKSRTLSGSPLDAIWPLFDQRLRRILAYVRKELGVRWFPLGDVERQLTAHSGGGFFAPHVDTGHSLTVTRRISCVYYFHSSPRRFTGGELKLYDSWVTDGGSTAAPTCTTLTPIDNSIVFFPSDEFHEVCPVHLETDAFHDSRFAITIWFREGQMPAQLAGVAAQS